MSVRLSIMLSPPKPFDKIQPNLVCELLTSHKISVQRQFFFGSAPCALGRGQKVKYHFISITKSISRIFISNFVCVLTNTKVQNLSDRIFILSTGSYTRGCLGVKNKILSIRPLCYLLLNHWKKPKLIWCVSYSHELGVEQQKKIGPAP